MRPILHQQQPFYKTPLRSLSWPMRPLETKRVGLQGPEKRRILQLFLGDAPPARSGYRGASFFVGRFVESFTCHWDKNIPMCVSMNSAPNSVFVWTSGFWPICSRISERPKFEKCPRCCFILYLCWYELSFHFCGSRWIPNSNCFSEQTNCSVPENVFIEKGHVQMKAKGKRWIYFHLEVVKVTSTCWWSHVSIMKCDVMRPTWAVRTTPNWWFIFGVAKLLISVGTCHG